MPAPSDRNPALVGMDTVHLQAADMAALRLIQLPGMVQSHSPQAAIGSDAG